MRNLIFCILAVLFLSSCGPTKYTARSDTWTHAYGYDDAPLDSTTYQVTYFGDASMPSNLVDRYALYRSAELTVAKGFNYFIVMDGQANANTTTSTMPGMESHNTTIEHDIDPQTGQIIPVAVTTTSQNYTTTSYTAHTVIKTIRMFKGERPADNANAYDAKSMLSVMGPTISR